MKVEFGDLTINQIIKICKGNYRRSCNGCPLFGEIFGCIANEPPYAIGLYNLHEWEIDLPDEEMKEDAEIH